MTSHDEPSIEVSAAGSEIAVSGDRGFDEELAAEQKVWRSVIWGTLVATPICVVIWMLIVVIAVGPEDPEHWLAWLGIGAIVGVLAGAFFGGWAGFTMRAHLLDDVDARAARH